MYFCSEASGRAPKKLLDWTHELFSVPAGPGTSNLKRGVFGEKWGEEPSVAPIIPHSATALEERFGKTWEESRLGGVNPGMWRLGAAERARSRRAHLDQDHPGCTRGSPEVDPEEMDRVVIQRETPWLGGRHQGG